MGQIPGFCFTTSINATLPPSVDIREKCVPDLPPWQIRLLATQASNNVVHFVTWKLAINTFWDHYASFLLFIHVFLYFWLFFLVLRLKNASQKYGTVKTNYRIGFCLQDCQLIQRQGKPISVDMKGNMRLPQASEEDNGKYTCLIDINLDGRNYTASRSILLTVKDGKYCRALILNP